MEKMSGQIHVNSYKRKDGTVVKEHYRGGASGMGALGGDSAMDGDSAPLGNSQEENYQNTSGENGGIFNSDEPLFEYNPKTPPLQGYLEATHIVDNPSPDQEISRNLLEATSGLKIPDNINDNIEFKTDNHNQSALSMISSAIDDVVQKTKNELKLTGQISSSLKQAIHSQIQNVEQSFLESQNLEKNLLDKLTNTKSQQEYKNIYNKYVIQRNLNEKNKNLVNQLKYSTSNNNYENAVETLNNYKSNYKELVKRNSKERPLKKDSIPKKILKIICPPYYTTDIINNNLAKGILNFIVPIGNLVDSNRLNDAKKLWEMSSHDFKYNEKYVNKNGALIYSVNDIPDANLRGLVSKKLNQQVNQYDTMGMIYNSKSNMSKQMAVSPEIKEHFQKNKDNLLSGNLVKNKSTRFSLSKNPNLALAIGGSDIPYSYIDKNGDLVNLVFDTYDFNPFESNLLVKFGRNAQEKKVIRNYYSLTVVKTPKKVWQKWLK